LWFLGFHTRIIAIIRVAVFRHLDMLCFPRLRVLIVLIALRPRIVFDHGLNTFSIPPPARRSTDEVTDTAARLATAAAALDRSHADRRAEVSSLRAHASAEVAAARAEISAQVSAQVSAEVERVRAEADERVAEAESERDRVGGMLEAEQSAVVALQEALAAQERGLCIHSSHTKKRIP
jgi:hypothetical protein